MLEIEGLETLRHRLGLRIDQFQLVPGRQRQRRIGLGRHADPVDAGGRHLRAVGLDGDLEIARMERLDQRRIELQQWLAAGAHHQAVRGRLTPAGCHGSRKRLGIGKLAAARPVGANEIRVAKGANRLGAILFPPGPQIAAGKAQENRPPPGLRTFTLQGEEQFLDRVTHGAGSAMPASAKPLARRRQESHRPQGVPAGVGS